MFKTILLIAYYFEPCNYVAANRPSTLAKELINQGYNVIVVTRHWNGNEKYWDDYLDTNNNEVEIEKRGNLIIHKLPYNKITLSSNSIKRKVKLLYKFFNGEFHTELDCFQFKPYIEKLISNNSIDLLIVSSPPLNIVKLAYELKLKYGLKYMVDIRDFENKVVLNNGLPISLKERFIHFCVLLNVKNWFKNAYLIFTVTPPFTDFFKKNANESSITVMNGYSEKLLDLNEEPYSKFYISYVGTLYNNPELKTLLEGIKLLFQQGFSKNITFNFIGTNANQDVSKELIDVVPKNNLIMQDRISQIEAQKAAAKSQILLVLGYNTMKGVFGTKFFEYMGLRKPIVLFPSDNGPMQALLTESNSGNYALNPQEFVKVVENLYLEWEETGAVKFTGNLKYIEQFSRENQYKKLVKYLDQI